VGYIKKILPKIVRSIIGVKIEELGIDGEMKDHVHLVMKIPPKYNSNNVIRRLKRESVSMMRKKLSGH
jgi:REP element-mobilizing transposase RayT